ncbi:transcriptional regulator [Defluviimonas sp. 20V17]|uniref:DNA-binding transcriptional regulator, LysR family n=1 Tax=Allgaiera indica TaxID=765699 RepID=A0AAN5A2U8_9RHOB|nr:LysR family transcriptional regulator [Allgaiera indica]KDB04147.1 transcriptional regulator [Defluviimonas sp. 20V17]GHE06077.1 LysR family transcriptional regulator [Allgaiera indica]SDX84342.1 DNA-binding transcriptional regulator, LysR family [Allgaiera indica]
MNIEHARTFLAVADTGSFVAAAERLHVTQSTVSARIRTLEDQLGTRLFTRNKAGAALTAGGGRFLKHAAQMVRALERARQDVGLPRKFRARVVIGARFGLWEGLMMRWFADIQHAHPQVSFHSEIGFEPELMQSLVEGRMDIGVMFTPQRRPMLELLPLLNEHLVLVSTEPTSSMQPDSYIHVDWGPEFDTRFRASFPEFPGPAISANIAWLGLQYLKINRGSGYFPRRLVEHQVDSGALFPVPGAPVFELPAWIVLREDRNKALVDPMLRSLMAAQVAP